MQVKNRRQESVRK